MPTERVVTAVRMHPVAIIRSVLWILGGAILAGLLTGTAHGNSRLVLVIWLLWGVLFVWQGCKIATWWRRYFVVTENRLMLVTSLVFTDVAMMPLAKVTDLRLSESILGRMLRYGEFIVESAGQEQALSRGQVRALSLTDLPGNTRFDLSGQAGRCRTGRAPGRAPGSKRAFVARRPLARIRRWVFGAPRGRPRLLNPGGREPASLFHDSR